MRGLCYRIFLTCINIFFPPLAVAMLCGFGWDLTVNCCLFLLAVIPSHVHGFYISCTYFHRRHKVKKGRWPGGPKSMIESPHVINGGASEAEARRLYLKEHGMERKGSRRGSREPSVRRTGGQRPEMVQGRSSPLGRADSGRPSRHGSQLGRTASNRGRRPVLNRMRTDEHTARDGYGAS
ncbi:Proteolipid membrane potential modulator [Teratosphaeria destructans]|uniref:Proteolipid membrane potential modulator n=1 Tax=Teratosphaeria destructans TaxID=418781 RepID=A0A9W7SK37_9PEZI|nr:Proteolipid membrane potential modulator [Teratosphaeria destructans]